MSENNNRRLLDNLLPVLNRVIDLGHNLIRWRTIYADRVVMRTGTVEETPMVDTDIPNKAYVDTATGGGLTVSAADGTPTFSGITEILFDEVDGFTLSQPGAGQVRIDIPSAAITGGGTTGTLASWDSPTSLIGDARLQWDSANGRISFNDPFVAPTAQFTIGMKDTVNDKIQVKVPSINLAEHSLEYLCHRGVKGAEAAVQNGDLLFEPLNVKGHTGAAFVEAAGIRVTARDVTATVVSADIVFQTANIIGAPTDRLTLRSGGGVLVHSLAGIGTRTVQVASDGTLSSTAVTLNGLSASAQTFVNDTNVTMVSSGSTHTITWAGTLAPARFITGSVFSGGIPYFSGTTSVASTSALTARAMVVGGGAGTAPRTVASALTSGQLYIGSTGSDPVAASLTAGAGISITPGGGSITIAATGTTASAITPTTFAALPAASGAWGPVRILTDTVRGFAIDTHNTSPAVDQWVQLNRPCNAKLFGAKSDGTTNDDVAIRAAIAAGCGQIFLPTGTIWKVAGNALPAPPFGTYTIIGENAATCIVACSAFPGSCASTNVTWTEGITLQNVTVVESFGDGSTAGAARIVQSSSNRAGDGSTNFHVAAQWDRGISYHFGAANTGTPAGSDVQGLSITQSTGGDALYIGGNAQKILSGTNVYATRLINLEQFDTTGPTQCGGSPCNFQGTQSILLTYHSGVINTTGFQFETDNDSSISNIDAIHMKFNNGAISNGTYIRCTTGGTEKFKLTSAGDIVIQGSQSFTGTKTVRDAAGTGTCDLVFVAGILTTASTC